MGGAAASATPAADAALVRGQASSELQPTKHTWPNDQQQGCVCGGSAHSHVTRRF